jgi:hypothetical protein
MEKPIKLYKPYFVIKDSEKEFLNKYSESRVQNRYVNSNSIFKEAVIRTNKYANVITDHFRSINKKLKNNIFSQTRELTKELNINFSDYDLKFIFIGQVNPLDVKESGIQEMETGSMSYEINVICNQFFKSNFITSDEKLFGDFYDLMVHELTHRGQLLLKKIKNLEIELSKKTNYGEKQYLSDRYELMAYANQTIEELRFEGYTDNQIIVMIKSFNFKDCKSAIISYYLKVFDKHKNEDLKILKQFFKYIYEYLIGDRKREF